MIKLFLSDLLTRLIDILRGWLGWLYGLGINDFSPPDGWAGTIVTIVGNGFSSDRDDNIVTIGGAPALMIEADANRLVVLAGEATVSGPIVVKVGTDTATSPGHFIVKPYPTATDLHQAGAPIFFHGPQHGTPTTNVQNQKVQVIIAYPTDQDPGRRHSALPNATTSSIASTTPSSIGTRHPMARPLGT